MAIAGANPTGYSNCSCGQLATSATPAQLPDHSASEIILSAPSSNTAPVYIGTSNGVLTTNGFALSPGQTITVKLVNTNMLWVVSAAAQVISWMANY